MSYMIYKHASPVYSVFRLSKKEKEKKSKSIYEIY